MSVYSQYSINDSYAGSNIVANESYSGTVGAFRIIEEGALNEHEIFKHVIRTDFAEAYAKHGAISESSLEAISEAGIGEIFDKLKEFIDKMWQKILGIIKSVITKIQSVFIRDGKELVKKYEKDITAKMNKNLLSKMKVKYYKGDKTVNLLQEGKSFIDTIASSDLGESIANIVTEITKMKKGASEYIDGFGDSEDYEADKEKEVSDKYLDGAFRTPETKARIKFSHSKDGIFKPFTSDEIQDMKDSALSKFVKSPTTTQDFLKDIIEEWQNDERDEDGFDVQDLRYCKDILENFDKNLKKLEKDERDAKKAHKDQRKSAETAQKEFNKIMMEKTPPKKATMVGNAFCTKMIQVLNAEQHCISIVFSAYTTLLKKEFAQARSLWVKAASFNGKAESASLMQGIDEMCEYEVESAFEM